MSLWFATVIMPPLVSFVAYLLLATLYTLPHVRRGLGGVKLQQRSTPLGPTLRGGIVFALVNSGASFLLSLALWPVYQRSGLHLGPLPSVGSALLGVALFLLVDDAIFYFTHRLLHTPFLFRHIHSWHHRIHAPFAL